MAVAVASPRPHDVGARDVPAQNAAALLGANLLEKVKDVIPPEMKLLAPPKALPVNKYLKETAGSDAFHFLAGLMKSGEGAVERVRLALGRRRRRRRSRRSSSRDAEKTRERRRGIRRCPATLSKEGSSRDFPAYQRKPLCMRSCIIDNMAQP